MSLRAVLVLMVLVVIGIGLHGSGRLDGLLAMGRDEPPVPPSSERQVVVYGRPQCGYTAQMLSSLQQAGIPHVFVDIDTRDGQLFYSQKFDTPEFGRGKDVILLPIVELRSHASMRPDPSAIATSYRISQRG